MKKNIWTTLIVGILFGAGIMFVSVLGNILELEEIRNKQRKEAKEQKRIDDSLAMAKHVGYTIYSYQTPRMRIHKYDSRRPGWYTELEEDTVTNGDSAHDILIMRNTWDGSRPVDRIQEDPLNCHTRLPNGYKLFVNGLGSWAVKKYYSNIEKWEWLGGLLYEDKPYEHQDSCSAKEHIWEDIKAIKRREWVEWKGKETELK